MATTFFKYKSSGGFTKSKGPACAFQARREFAAKIAGLKSGALELVDAKGDKLEEWAAPDMWSALCDATAENAYRHACRKHEAEGLPAPPVPVWRKSY